MTVLVAPGVRLTGWSFLLPGADPTAPGVPPPLREAVRQACAPVEPRAVLGRGLKYKEPATQLALCAVHGAGLRPGAEREPRTAVVAAGNLGNVETVVSVARAVRAGGVRAVSPLAAPNASSNVLASSVALRFRLAGPNIMLCSGAGAGLDGLTTAVRLLRADRADRVVLVGAEPDDEIAAALHGGRLRAAAGCVVLERSAGAGAGAGAGPPAGTDLRIGPDGFDPVRTWGDAYGAQGVISVALAAASGCCRVEVVCGDTRDGWRSAVVYRELP